MILEFSRALPIKAGVRSKPLTNAPILAAVRPTTPVPHATSKTLEFLSTLANRINLGAAVLVKASKGINEDHPSLAFSFNLEIQTQFKTDNNWVTGNAQLRRAHSS